MSDIADQQEINRLNALVERLLKEVREADSSHAKSLMEFLDMKTRAESAEAQVAALREALEQIAHKDTIYGTMPEIARKALEATR